MTQRPFESLLIYVLLLLSLTVSCDLGLPLPRFSLKQKNVSYSQYPTGPFEMAADAYYCNIGLKYWTVIERRWTTVPGPGPCGDFILICFDKLTKSGPPEYEFIGGLKVLAYDVQLDTPTASKFANLPDNCTFFAEQIGISMKIAYTAKISEKWYFPEDWHKVEEYWLRFNVRAKNDSQKVSSVIKKLHPLLAEEKDAESMIECLKPLLE